MYYTGILVFAFSETIEHCFREYLLLCENGGIVYHVGDDYGFRS